MAFVRRLRQEVKPKEFPEGAQGPPKGFEVNGCWINTGKQDDDETCEKTLANLRKLDIPVFLFKIIRTMFWRFNIRASDNLIMFQGEKKLLHTAQFFFKLDQI